MSMSSWDDFMMLIRRKHQHSEPQPSRPGSPKAETLAPLMEGPEVESFESASSKKEGKSALQHWMKGQLAKGPSASTYKRSDLHLLLGVLGTPLAPVTVNNDPIPLISIKGNPIEASSAQYILQQYIAASGARLQSSTQNSYALGRVKMLTSEYETATKVTKTKHPSKAAETGVFVLWQMMPDMWYVELVVGGNKVYAGSNGKLVWRHTPWLGAHAAKGPIRPLRRVLQGLDPRSTASMFADAKCIGEKKINGEDCFILKLIVDPATLASRSDGPVDIIRHVLFGYFSQRSGLLIHMEDSHLTRIQSSGGDAIYWETTINSYLEDYRPIDGVMIAHSGRTIATLFRFGEVAMSHTKTRMEEEWTIEEVAFNVPGLSMDCFIPPADIRYGPVGENYELPHEDRGKRTVGNRSKVVALEKSQENLDNIIWRVEV